MEFKVEMEDGTWELVANCHITENFADWRVHSWGDVWLVATLTDDVVLTDEKGGQLITMGNLRELDAGCVTFIKTGGEPRRPRTFKGRKGINTDARPFNNKGE